MCEHKKLHSSLDRLCGDLPLKRNMRTGRTIVHLLLLAATGLVEAESLKISSFNIQVFGRSKLSKTDVVDVLKQVRAPVFRLPASPVIEPLPRRECLVDPSPSPTQSRARGFLQITALSFLSVPADSASLRHRSHSGDQRLHRNYHS